MPYIYSLDLPSSDPQVNRRLGYRVPRSILCPPYLMMNPFFVDFMDAVDGVFGPNIDEKIDVLAGLRNMWVTNPTMETQLVEEGQMVPFSAWSQPEREILVKQVNMLGMKLSSAGVVSNDSYHAISRFLGQYWFEKGTQAFIEFINFCLNARLTVSKLWTQDYENFFPEGDANIGTPIWEGGTWYPTTHVNIVASGGLEQLTPQTLINFFYEIANYNLVLNAIDSSYDMHIVDRFEDGHISADIVAIGLFAENSIAMSNNFQYGADAPPTYDVAPDLPTRVLMANPADTNYANQFIMGNPTAWITDADGDKIPVYGEADQTTTEAPDLPTTLMGEPSTTGNMDGYVLLYGPTSWAQVPGSSRSKARIPYFTALPTERTVGVTSLSTRILGSLRANLLVNPKGFKQFTTGQWTPYW